MSHFAHYSADDARNVGLFPGAFAVCQSQSKRWKTENHGDAGAFGRMIIPRIESRRIGPAWLSVTLVGKGTR